MGYEQYLILNYNFCFEQTCTYLRGIEAFKRQPSFLINSGTLILGNILS